MNKLLIRDKDLNGFRIGQSVYLFQPRGLILKFGYRKCSVGFVGPLVILKVLALINLYLCL